MAGRREGNGEVPLRERLPTRSNSSGSTDCETKSSDNGEGDRTIRRAGPNDVIALEAIGALAVGLCANAVTAEQADEIAMFSQEVGSIITVMFDCTEEGSLAARVAIVELAQHCPVRLAWSPAMHAGAFKGRKADSLTSEEWEGIRILLLTARSRPMRGRRGSGLHHQ